MKAWVSGAVEGDLDEAVTRRLVEDAGAGVSAVYGKRGSRWLRERLAAFNRAAQREPWFVLTDLDQVDCPPTLAQGWRPAVAARYAPSLQRALDALQRLLSKSTGRAS